MKKLVLTAAAVVAMSTASLAMADGLAQGPAQNQVKHGGFYVGGGAGYANINEPKAVADSGVTVKNDFGHIAANAHAGYLFPVTKDQRFLLGVEGGYNYLPTLKYTVTAGTGEKFQSTLDEYSLDFLGVAKYYVTDQIDVFAKAGGTYLKATEKDSTIDSSGNTISQSYDKGRVKPKIGVGAGYMIMPQLELTAEYDHTFGTDFKDTEDAAKADKDAMPSNNIFLVGLNYYF